MASFEWGSEAHRQARAGSITHTHMLKVGVRLRPVSADAPADILRIEFPAGSWTAWKVTGTDAESATVTQVSDPGSGPGFLKRDAMAGS